MCERRRGRRRGSREGACRGGATMPQPSILRLILSAAALWRGPKSNWLLSVRRRKNGPSNPGSTGLRGSNRISKQQEQTSVVACAEHIHQGTLQPRRWRATWTRKKRAGHSKVGECRVGEVIRAAGRGGGQRSSGVTVAVRRGRHGVVVVGSGGP